MQQPLGHHRRPDLRRGGHKHRHREHVQVSCQDSVIISVTEIYSVFRNIVADSCNGDSGGGLTASNVDGREVILGIVSFGEPDCGR